MNDKIKFGKREDEYKLIPFNSIRKLQQYTDEKDFDRANIDSLKEKIKDRGFDKTFPLAVDESTEANKYNVVSGNHRFVALDELAKEGFLKPDYPVPAIIKGFKNYQDRLAYQVMENQRRIPLATDEGKAYRQLYDIGESTEAIAKRFGIRKDIVETRLHLTFLSPDLFKLVDKGLPMTIASAIAKSSLQDNKPNYDLQLDLYKWYQANKHQYNQPYHIESRAKELTSTGFDFFVQDTLSEAQKKGLTEAGSKEEAERTVDRIKKTFDAIQKAYQKLFGEDVSKLNPDLVKKISGSLAFANDNSLDRLSIILIDLSNIKKLIENKIRVLKGQTEIPIVFANNLQSKIDKVQIELDKIPNDKINKNAKQEFNSIDKLPVTKETKQTLKKMELQNKGIIPCDEPENKPYDKSKLDKIPNFKLQEMRSATNEINPSPKAKDYKLKTSEGKPIRTATKVVFNDGREVKFMDKLPKKEAIKQAGKSSATQKDKNNLVQFPKYQNTIPAKKPLRLIQEPSQQTMNVNPFRLEQEREKLKEDKSFSLFQKKKESSFLKKNFKPKYKYDLASFSIPKFIESVKKTLLENSMDDRAREFVEQAYKMNEFFKIKNLFYQYCLIDSKELSKLEKEQYIAFKNQNLFKGQGND